MKVKKGFLMREMAGRFVVVPVGGGENSFRGMVQMNKVGAFLWKKLEQEQSREDLVSAVLKQYEVGEEQAKKDVDLFVEKLTDAGILEC